MKKIDSIDERMNWCEEHQRLQNVCKYRNKSLEQASQFWPISCRILRCTTTANQVSEIGQFSTSDKRYLREMYRDACINLSQARF